MNLIWFFSFVIIGFGGCNSSNELKGNTDSRFGVGDGTWEGYGTLHYCVRGYDSGNNLKSTEDSKLWLDWIG